VWLLMGRRACDNNQLLALAAEAGFPYAPKKLSYHWRRGLPRRRPGLSMRNFWSLVGSVDHPVATHVDDTGHRATEAPRSLFDNEEHR
jgi:hypothetical protein